MQFLSADWLYSGAGLIQSNSGIRLDAQGRIVSIEHLAGSDHFAGAVLMPGLVNAHTHLELTGFDGQDEEPDFPRWIRRIIELKAGRSEDDFFHAAQAGLQASFAAGVTTVADTGSSAGPLRALAELGAAGLPISRFSVPTPMPRRPTSLLSRGGSVSYPATSRPGSAWASLLMPRTR
jgi:5-methylthioadenosine/S-adenosylhomocysteine deaminase